MYIYIYKYIHIYINICDLFASRTVIWSRSQSASKRALNDEELSCEIVTL